jgi:hypothetical protein
MFTRKQPEKTDLDRAIELLVDRMSSADDEQAARLADQVSKLYKLKEIDTPKHISPDTLILVAGNLAGIVLILYFEKANVLTSRALNFVMKLR